MRLLRLFAALLLAPSLSAAGFVRPLAPVRSPLSAPAWSVPVRSVLARHDALLLGEHHMSLAAVGALAAELPALADAGVAVVGLEGLKVPHQEAMDDYVAGRTDALPEAALSFSPRRRAAFQELVDAARGAGVRVAALGRPLDEWAAEARALAVERTSLTPEIFPSDTDGLFHMAQSWRKPGFNESVAEVYLSRRNADMARKLAAATPAGKRAAALVGHAHLLRGASVTAGLLQAPGDWGSLPEELLKLGRRAYSLAVTGGGYVDFRWAEADRRVRAEVHDRAALVSPGGQPAFLDVESSAGIWHAGGRVAPNFEAAR